jgi:hypothetical protein
VAPPSDDDHDCGWKTYAREQERELESLKDGLAALERLLHGKKSEKRKDVKLPPPLPKEITTRAAQRPTRDALAELRATRMETEVEKVPVAAEARRCRCGSSELRELAYAPCPKLSAETARTPQGVLWKTDDPLYENECSLSLKSMPLTDCQSTIEPHTSRGAGEK